MTVFYKHLAETQSEQSCAGFLLYFVFCSAAICVLIFYLAPKEGSQSVFIYIGICSLVGSLTVMSVKASIPFPLQFSDAKQKSWALKRELIL